MSTDSEETDKISQGYLPAYLEIAGNLKAAQERLCICEIGVQKGYSLMLWQEMFPGALIVGVDRDESAVWPQDTIRIVYAQEDPFLAELLKCAAPGYDLIVDDASHLAGLTIATWQNLWPLVKPGCYYVIEDWHVGFPTHRFHRIFGVAPQAMAKNFLNLLDEPGRMDIESIQYRYGMIIFRKRS